VGDVEARGVREAIDALLGTVESVMEPDTLFLRPDQSLSEAAVELEKAGISGGPVMSGRFVVGMVSLSDLFEAAGVAASEAATSGPWHRYEHTLAQTGKTVADAMSRQVVSMQPDASIAEAASLMRLHRVNRIPVVDRSGTLRGIVARDDIIRSVARVAHALHAARAHPGASALAPG
jgi:CBS domain-containing protein